MNKTVFHLQLEESWRRLYDSNDSFLQGFYDQMFLAIDRIDLDIFSTFEMYRKEKRREILALSELTRYAIVGRLAHSQIVSFYNTCRFEEGKLLAATILNKMGDDRYYSIIHTIFTSRHPEPVVHADALVEMVFGHCSYSWCDLGQAST